MDELALLNQTAAVAQATDGIKTGFPPLDTPGSLNGVDLPAAIPFIAGGTRDVDSLRSGRAECAMLESLNITLRVYITPAGQGYSIGDVVAFSIPFLGLVFTAFDGRRRLVNATGNNPNDFDATAAGLDQARIRNHRGVSVQPYGEIDYFVADFTLVCDGRRSTPRVKGN